MNSKRLAQALTSTGQQAAVSIQGAVKDKMSVFVEDTVGGTFIIRIQGRVEPTDSWKILRVLLEGNLDANDTYIEEFSLMPEVAVRVMAIGGGASLNVRVVSK